MVQPGHLFALADEAGEISALAARAEASFAEATAATPRAADSPEEVERRRALIANLGNQLVRQRAAAEKMAINLGLFQSIASAQAISVAVCATAADVAENGAVVAQTAVQKAQGTFDALLAASRQQTAQGAAATQGEAAAAELAARAIAVEPVPVAKASAAEASAAEAAARPALVKEEAPSTTSDEEVAGRSISPERAPQTAGVKEEASSPRRRGRSLETSSGRSARGRTSASGSRTPAQSVAEPRLPHAAASAAASAAPAQPAATAAAAVAAETAEPIWRDVPRPPGYKISLHGVPNAWGIADVADWLSRCECVPDHTYVTLSGRKNARRFTLTFTSRDIAKKAKRRLDHVPFGSGRTRTFHWSSASE